MGACQHVRAISARGPSALVIATHFIVIYVQHIVGICHTYSIVNYFLGPFQYKCFSITSGGVRELGDSTCSNSSSSVMLA
jgi:hypothetical protein